MTRTPPGRPVPAATRRAASSRSARRSGLGSTLVGIFIGIAVGLGLAAIVAFYLMKSGNPYQAAAGGTRESKDPAKSVRSDAAPSDKPRFDFYKILPGAEESKQTGKAAERIAPDKATLDRAASPDKSVAKVEEAPPPKGDKAGESSAKAPKAGERFWIQAGSFTNENDAENLKAQLALSGWEASVQHATLPDKGARFRVRLGPYDNAGELNRVKDDLTKHGVDVAVIKGQ